MRRRLKKRRLANRKISDGSVMIYALAIDGRRFVKIGFSSSESSSERIASLQTGCPYHITEILTTWGTIRQEKSLHSALKTMFARVRIPVPANEWYPGKHPLMRQFLENLAFGPDAAMTFAEKYNPAVKQHGDAEARAKRKKSRKKKT